VARNVEAPVNLCLKNTLNHSLFKLVQWLLGLRARFVAYVPNNGL
jgi:hypothetical protein